MQGFAEAAALGCGMVECDIRLSADGALVLAHDPEVKAADGKRYAVADYSVAELAALDLGRGEGVPTLQQLVDWARGRCGVMADMKCEGGAVEEMVVEALRALPRESKIVPGAGPQSRRRFRSLDPSLPISLSIGPGELDDFDALLPAIDTDAVTWHHTLLDAGRIAALHARGLVVYAWTVDDVDTMRRLIDAGADGIISNRADLFPDAL
jgi:glycerophosphoryl diester phosphodiesterase